MFKNTLFGAIAVIVAVLLLFDSDPRPTPAQIAKGTPGGNALLDAGNVSTPGAGAQVAMQRAADGHFYADVRINGASMRMLVDTGATMVLLSRQDAQRAGIAALPGEFTHRGATVGGEIALKPVRIDRIELGSIEGRDIAAVVAENDVPISLLGQTFLSRIERVEINDDEMVLH